MDLYDARCELKKLAKTGHDTISREGLYAAFSNVADAHVHPEKVIGLLLDEQLITQSAEENRFLITGAKLEQPAVTPNSNNYEDECLVSAKKSDVIVPFLIVWHNYKPGPTNTQPINYTPVTVGWVAKQLDLSKATVSDFFTAEFGSHAKYVALCKTHTGIINQLRRLNEELRPNKWKLIDDNPI